MLPQTQSYDILSVSENSHRQLTDTVAREEPLEIRVRLSDREEHSLAITMRTPGQDEDLAVGFLWGEGIVSQRRDIIDVHVGGPIQPGGFRNVVSVGLRPGIHLDLEQSTRRFYLSSSCGVCGKASLDRIDVHRQFELRRNVPVVAATTVLKLPDLMRTAQETFEQTGGLHAACLFAPDGELLLLREDVGRHNAVDKIIGAAIRSGWLPLSNNLLLVSGRASYELVQKAVMAGIPVLAAIGAPSSLAVALARDSGMTLVGFLRGTRFNIYSAQERIAT